MTFARADWETFIDTCCVRLDREDFTQSSVHPECLYINKQISDPVKVMCLFLDRLYVTHPDKAAGSLLTIQRNLKLAFVGLSSLTSHRIRLILDEFGIFDVGPIRFCLIPLC